MNKILAAVSLLSLLGCSGCDSVPSIWEFAAPTNGCLGPYYVKDNVGKLNPTALAQDEQMLKALFTTPFAYHPQDHDGNIDYTRTLWHEKLLPSEKAFCESFGGIHITFIWTQEFPCGNEDCWGLNTPNGGIYLEYSANSFAHELLHTYEWENGIFDTASHPNWDTKGYHYFNDTLWWNERSPQPMTGPNGEQTPPVLPVSSSGG